MKKKIVVVDDEADICRLLKVALETRDFEVHTAPDGEAGKEVIERVHPDLLVCDVKMPRMNGYELISQLKQSYKYHDLPIIVLTSLTEDHPKGDEGWRKSLGVADFISKPFDTRDFVERVERALTRQPA